MPTWLRSNQLGVLLIVAAFVLFAVVGIVNVTPPRIADVAAFMMIVAIAVMIFRARKY